MADNFTISVTSWHLAFNSGYLYLGMSMYNSVEVYAYVYTMVYKLTKVYTNDTWS